MSHRGPVSRRYFRCVESRSSSRRLPSARRSCRTTPGRCTFLAERPLVHPHVLTFLGAGYKITDACDCVPSCDAQNIVLSDSSTCSSKALSTASEASTTKTTSRPLFAASPSPRHAGRRRTRWGTRRVRHRVGSVVDEFVRSFASLQLVWVAHSHADRPDEEVAGSNPVVAVFVDFAEVRGLGRGRGNGGGRRIAGRSAFVVLLHHHGRHERRGVIRHRLLPVGSDVVGAREHHHANAAGAPRRGDDRAERVAVPRRVRQRFLFPVDEQRGPPRDDAR